MAALAGIPFRGRGSGLAGQEPRVTSYAEFAEGQAQGVLISSLGDVRPGYSQNRLPLPSLTLDSVRALKPRRQMAHWLGAGAINRHCCATVPARR